MLLLLLHPLDLLPDKVPGLPLQRDGLDLLWLLQFQHVLHLPDALKCTRQPLYGALLLLLLLLLLAASLPLLATFCHKHSPLMYVPRPQAGNHVLAKLLLISYTRRVRKIDTSHVQPSAVTNCLAVYRMIRYAFLRFLYSSVSYGRRRVYSGGGEGTKRSEGKHRRGRC